MPKAVSSKVPVSTFRQVFPSRKQEHVDPRFHPTFGEYKPEIFRKQYGFVNDIRKRDKQVLVEELKKEEDPEKKEVIKKTLSSLKQKIESFEENEKKEKVQTEIKRKIYEEAKDGSKPHFINKSEQKLLELAEKYKELKKSGKVEKYLAKKRKKNFTKILKSHDD